MAIAERRYEHILIDEQGVPQSAGTTMKDIELVLDHREYGWSPEELCFQHPHLTLGQVYAALAYYADHRDERDELIQQQLERVTQLQSSFFA
jgi:uncharacterized protein (DUF433 family)